jgi:hypothetical protein
VLHTLTATSVTSQGGIFFEGAPSGANMPGLPGGQLTINVGSLSFGTSAPADIIGSVNFNGSQGNAGAAGGSGGIFTVNATGPVTVNSDIEATSGYQPVGLAPAGDGGTVNLTSSNDAVSITSRLEVSSVAPASNPSQVVVRRSAKGGNINITSGKPTGVAINVSNSAQLLALLDAAAPGPGGKITILATGTGGSQANVAGTVAAERGVVDIRHTGDNGQINLATGAGDTINVRGDIVKVGALGNNGMLNIGGGTISADTMLKLYAPGSNGTINFIANVTLSGAGTKIIAGDTVNVFDKIVVTIGGSNPASVFTNHANYSTLSGGNGLHTGTFSGAGANKPQLLLNAPLLGPPGG